MLNKSLFSSDRMDWETPNELFNQWNSKFNFTLDVCALPKNAKCQSFFTPEEDGLTKDWSGERCWMNPPYGKDIVKWVKKASEEAKKGSLIVALLPARTDTAWFHKYVLPYADLVFLRGRVRFVGESSSAPFPSIIAQYIPNTDIATSDLNTVVKPVSKNR